MPKPAQAGYTGRAAIDKIGCTHYMLLKYVALGEIKIEAILGSPIRYNSADVDAIAAGREPGHGQAATVARPEPVTEAKAKAKVRGKGKAAK